MLLDIGSVLAGIGLGVVGFVIVILVCVVILRMLAAILPSYEDRTTVGETAGHESPGGETSADAAGVGPSSDAPAASADVTDPPD